MTADGAQVVDYSACKGKRSQRRRQGHPSGEGVELPADRRCRRTRGVSSASPIPPRSTSRSRSIRNDGGSWEKVKLPIDDNTEVTAVTATSNGFLMAEQVAPAPGADYSAITTKLLSSTDGRTWTPLSAADLPSAYSLAIAGDRIIGTDATGSKLYVSSDAGATWTKSQDIADLVGAPGVEHRRRVGRLRAARVRGGGHDR